MQRRTRTLLILALVLVGFFTVTVAFRALHHARRLRAGSEEPIQAWMNIPYIAHNYRVPPDLIHQAIGLPLGRRDRRPLRAIAREQGRPPQALIDAITAAILEARAAPEPPVPPLPPRPPLESETAVPGLPARPPVEHQTPVPPLPPRPPEGAP